VLVASGALWRVPGGSPGYRNMTYKGREVQMWMCRKGISAPEPTSGGPPCCGQGYLRPDCLWVCTLDDQGKGGPT